jgi:hypothetical protein
MREKSKIRMLRLVRDPKAVVGVIISMAGIYWAFKDFQFLDFKESIHQVDLLYLVLAILFLWGSVWLRGLRWKWLFKQNDSPKISSLYKAELIGYFGNNVLPLRLGELLRSYIISKECSLSKSFVFGTVVLERLMDTLALASFALLLLLTYPLEEAIRGYIMWGGIISFVVIAIFLIVLNHIQIFQTENKILTIIKKVLDGLSSIRKEMVIPVIISSLLIWCIYLLDVYLMQKAFQFNLSWSQVLTVLVISSLALSIPSAPGMIGTFHAAVKYTMVDLFAFSANDGNSFAILMHAYGYILFTSLGAYYFMKSQFHDYALKTVLKTGLKNNE